MALPGNLNNSPIITTTIHGFPTGGTLVYKYAPFQNLKNNFPGQGESGLSDLTLKAEEAGISVDKPIILQIEEAYDGSANLIISDRENPLKLVNSRFYLTDSSNYKIADRKGNLDTNIYTRDNFKTEAGLIKTTKSIVTLDFLGVLEGGRLPVGNYNFYFRLADFDGNETDFISESGQVVCYIGAVNKPSSIRGGLLDENSEKMVKFRLNDLDLAYDYINVYYTKNTGEDLIDTTHVYKVNNKFKITGTSTTVSITGYEEVETLSLQELNLRYALFDKVQTVTSCQNMVFAGNIDNNYELFSKLEKYSLFITPKISLESNIGNIDSNYSDNSINSNEYYNPDNIYYRLSYWDEEIYRFGIVYIMNDFSLSPVFNIRGKKNIHTQSIFNPLDITQEISYDENYNILYNDQKTDENVKGVFRIDLGPENIFSNTDEIKSIGIKLEFDPSLFSPAAQLEKITRGFFIVRQKRIPTILAQGLSIGTTKKGYIPTIKGTNGYLLESFLQAESRGNKTIPRLRRSIYTISDSEVNKNALICPEASIRNEIFGSIFNSSTFSLQKSKYQLTDKNFYGASGVEFNKRFFNVNMSYRSRPAEELPKNSELLLISPETSIINNKQAYFSSVAGNAHEAWKHTDPIHGNVDEIIEATLVDNKTLSTDTRKTRGIFNSYIGLSNEVEDLHYYNIYNKDYSINKIDDYFKIRYNDSSPFYPVSDRVGWNNLIGINSHTVYRGDCYISTYTHRVMWNFADPEFPTNNKIVDPYTWYKNYKVKETTIKISGGSLTDTDIVVEDNSNFLQNNTADKISYRKVLNTFTYKIGELVNDIDNGIDLNKATILTPEDKKFKKYSDSNGEFGTSKLNRADINAVGLGHWVTFKICSNINLALRDQDFNNPSEEAIYKRKRSFYPYSSEDLNNNLPESTVINKGISNTLGNRQYFEIPDVPFIKTSFTNRIYYSNLLIDSIFKDGSRVFESQNYQDYTLEYGQLVKLVEWYGSLIAVMEHGVLMIPVNERAILANQSGEDVSINTEKVLPKNPKVLSNTFGSTWSDSIIKTPRFIYGIDTIAKKIWRTNGESLEIISDMKIQKFLNDNILLKVTDKEEDIIRHFVKSHYNAFKYDVIFVFKYGLKEWVLSWNELADKWVTRYTWFPEFSENINNIFYTFANKDKHPTHYGKLFKHGWAGTLEEQNYIKSTFWYEQQHPFEFEFVVNGTQGVQKIFNNLKIISNKAEPHSFTYEVVGEGYDWFKYKEVISWMENHGDFNTGFGTEDLDFMYTEDGYYSISEGTTSYEDAYKFLLTHNMKEIEAIYPDFPRPPNARDLDYFMKLPYIPKVKTPSPIDTIDWNTLKYDTVLINDLWNGEDRVLSHQLGRNMNNVSFRRLKGNMHYVEDSWDIQIQPVRFRYAFMKGDKLRFSSFVEMKVRDKYVKIRVSYTGKKLVIINAIRTLLTISHA